MVVVVVVGGGGGGGPHPLLGRRAQLIGVVDEQHLHVARAHLVARVHSLLAHCGGGRGGRRLDGIGAEARLGHCGLARVTREGDPT